jgi:hypothetical protein
MHYLEKKHHEYYNSGKTPEILIDDLEKGISDFGTAFGPEAVEHLRTWKMVFRPEAGLDF